MNPMKINRASPIERMIPTSFDGTKSKAKSTPDTTSTEIKKYKAVSLRSFTVWIIAQKSRKAIKIVVQTEEGLFAFKRRFFLLFSSLFSSFYFIGNCACRCGLAAGGAVGLHKSGQWKRIKDTKILKRFAKQQVAVAVLSI